ncbi:MAG: metallophosphoesterase family protein [Planctomycetes bacterium]|nr:metallophosphoesterase family protein [Planctomycetota bacterium]
MALTAIISDIHGNLPALEAVLRDARSAGIDRVLCLGDIVGYGADPVRCLELVREVADQIIMGNHEHAVLVGPMGFNPLASAAVQWTRRQFDTSPDASDGLDFLGRLPHRIDDDELVLVHGSPSQPLDEYLFREDTLEHLPRSRDYAPKLANSFRLIDRPCFVGHTHVPGVIPETMTWIEPCDVPEGFDTQGRPCLVNVGSVGQPRDGVRDASYALFDGRAVTFRRVPYDVEEAARRIFDTDDLPDLLGERLLEAW